MNLNDNLATTSVFARRRRLGRWLLREYLRGRRRGTRREGRLSPLPNPANQILRALVRNPTLALFFPEAITKTRFAFERMTTL